jgi:hypothetical protein
MSALATDGTGCRGGGGGGGMRRSRQPLSKIFPPTPSELPLPCVL